MKENIQTRLEQMYEIDYLLFCSVDLPKFNLSKPRPKQPTGFITQKPDEES